jgi:hypothetical protein
LGNSIHEHEYTCTTRESLITGMVVTDDDHLLLCDVSCVNSELVTVYYPSGKYMKRIDVSYPPWDIAIIPRTHRAVVTFTKKKIQFINPTEHHS